MRIYKTFALLIILSCTLAVRGVDLLSPVFECTRFRLTFDSSGRVSSLFYKPLNRELISGTSGNDGFVVFNTGGSDVALTNVNRTSDGKLLASSANGQYQVYFGVVEQDRHISFKIEQLVGFPISSNYKLRFTINPNITSATSGGAIPVKYGGGVGVGVMSLDWMTWAEYSFQVEWQYLWHRGYNSADPIGGFAIFACSDSEMLETVGLVEVAEGLPHPMYDGQWAKVNNTIARLSQVWLPFYGNGERDRAVNYIQQGGFGMVYLPCSIWESGSPYTINTYNWPNGISDLRAFSDSLWSKGILLGLHTGSMSLWPADTVYVSPIPDDRLATWGRGTLAQNISLSDTVIYFTPDANTMLPTNTSESRGLRPPVYNNIWGWGMIRIGNEIIAVGNYDANTIPWKLSGCSRAQQGTYAANHNSNNLIRGLLTVYGHLAVDPDSSLLQEIADKMAAVVNSCNIARVSFDAIETAESGGRWGLGKFMTKAYQGFDHFVAADSSSGLVQWEWHAAAYVNSGELMSFYPKAYFQSYLLGGSVENFVPEGLGSLPFSVDDRNSAWHASTPDEWEWWLAKAAAYDATYLFATTLYELDNHGQTSDILALHKKWEKCRLAKVFTTAQMQQMQDFKTSYRLTSSGPKDANWQITPTKIVPAFVQPNSSVSVNNAYAPQPLRFEIRVLPNYDYNSVSNVSILPADISNFSIDSGLAVTKTGTQWKFVSSNSGPVQANWNHSTIDLSYKRGVGLRISGDSNGGYFYIEYDSGGMVRHYVVQNNFTGWKYVEIPDFEVSDYLYLDDLYYKFQNPYGCIRQGFRYNAIGKIAFGITNVPVGKTASITIEAPKALTETAVPLSNLQMNVDGGSLSVNGSVGSGNYVVYEGGNSAQVLDSNRHFVANLPVTISNWNKNWGTSTVTLSSQSTKPWLKILFKTLGTPFWVPNPTSDDFNHDGRIDFKDLQVIVANWLKEGLLVPGDVNGDNIVDFYDFAVLASDWIGQN